MPEIEQAQLEALQRTARSVSQILKDPARKMKLLELQKEAEPDAIIPELDTKKSVDELANGFKKTIEELKTELFADREKRENDRKLEEFQARMDEGRGYLKARGWNDEGIAKIEKFMEERGIARHEDALARYEQLFPPPAPVRSSGLSNFLEQAKFDNPENELVKKLVESKGEDNFILDRMIDEIRREG